MCIVHRLNLFPVLHWNFIHMIFNLFAVTPLIERFESEYGTLVTLVLFTGRKNTDYGIMDMPDEFPDHDAAITDYAATTDPHRIARVVGELSELLALPLDDGDYALAAAELGMEVDPPEPLSCGAWLQSVATRLSSV